MSNSTTSSSPPWLPRHAECKCGERASLVVQDGFVDALCNQCRRSVTRRKLEAVSEVFGKETLRFTPEQWEERLAYAELWRMFWVAERFLDENDQTLGRLRKAKVYLKELLGQVKEIHDAKLKNAYCRRGLDEPEPAEEECLW